MKVLFLTNVPSPYRVEFFNELGKYCDLTVVFEKKTSKERDKSWQNYHFDTFQGIFLKGISISTDTAFCFGLKKIIKKGNFDRIICANFSSPTGMRAISYMRKKKIPYYLESDGGVAKSGKGLKEKIKKHFISGAQGYFSTGKQHDGYYEAYGAEKECIYRYPFTSLFEKDIDKTVLSAPDKRELREKLNIKEEKVVVSVGRFSYLNGYGKGYDVLLKAAKGMDKTVGWYIVGGEPTPEFAAMKADLGLDNVHFIEFLNKERLKEYYRAADAFVLMTVGEAWGLVINEAMACGLPVITTDKCVAGVELVREGNNGYILPVGDHNGLTEKLQEIFAGDLQTEMGRRSLEFIRLYTIENMAKTHMEIFQRVLSKDGE